ncbi:MAG: hypothetical protein ACRDJW_23520 [Thermomicrobiales bacterium]
MQGLAKSVRLGVALVVLMALISLSPIPVGAQESPASATPQAAAPASSESSVASTSIDVTCAYDAALNQTACTFSALSETGVVDAVVVLPDTLCASVVSSTGAATGDGGFSAASTGGTPSLTIVLQGFAQPGGGGSYLVEANGAAQAAGGSGIVCSESNATVVDDPLVDPPTISPPSENGEFEVVPEVPAESAAATEGDGTTVDGSSNGEESLATGTPVAVPAPVTDGTGDPAGQAETAQTDDVAAAAIVSVPIQAYNCDTVEDTQDPATECAPAQGVFFDVAIDGETFLQVFTDASGLATFDAEEGSSVVIEEVVSTVPSGYVPLGGHQTIDSVEAGSGVVFVHLLVGGTETGNLQIVNGSCPTSDDEPRTEFNVIGPRTLAGASSSCVPTSGALFTIEGDLLPGGQLVVQTGSDGSWRGTVPAGDYTVIDDSGASAGLTVEPDSLTVVVVVDYIPQPTGTLTVTRFLCTEGDEEGLTITVDSAPGSGGPGCGPGDGDMSLSEDGDGTGGASQDFTLGSDGEALFELRAGDYLLTDVASGISATVTVAVDTVTAATVHQVVLTGRIVVQNRYCDDPSFGDVDPANYAAFSDGCRRPYANSPLTLFDGGGNVVDSTTGSGGGIIVWSQVVPGGYSVAGGADVCAVFAEGADARGGFAVSVATTTNVEVYSCAPPNPSGPNDGTGGSNGGTGQPGGGGDGTGGGSPTGTGDLYVTTLPATGVASVDPRATATFGLTGSFLVLFAAAALNALRRRTV